MSDLLKGKVVIVTGAVNGIGRAIAIAAAAVFRKRTPLPRLGNLYCAPKVGHKIAIL